MDESISIKKTNTRRIVTFLLNVLMAFMVAIGLYAVMTNASYNGDNYFMFANARALLKEGFVTRDPLSMHGEFEYVIPQWAFSILIYEIHAVLGDKANFYLMMALFIVIFLLLQRLCRIIIGSANYIIPFSLTFGLFSLYFCYLRPYLITTICNLLTLCILEETCRYNKTGRPYWLSVISVVQINFHNSLWISLFLILACYLAEEGWKTVRGEENKLRLLIQVTAVCVAAGFINPYGWKYMTYIFNSMVSIQPFKSYIHELKNIFFYWQQTAICSILLLMDLFLCGYFWKMYKKLPPIRYILLFVGFLIMSIISVRNLMFFISCGQLIMMLCLSKNELLVKDELFKGLSWIFIATSLIMSVVFVKMDITPKNNKDRGHYLVAEYLSERIEDKSLPVFSTFNAGSYLEYFEMKPYIDARAEVFGIANNKTEDIASTYMHLHDEGTDEEYQALFDRYEFQYAVTDGETSARFLNNSPDYILLYSNNGTNLYRRTAKWRKQSF